ncbi:MAG: hypothetical protein OEZ09_12895 [Betaproteobacteria bacterium]|nr:hypothetical protein [Betaproteobacteria bacterium]
MQLALPFEKLPHPGHELWNQLDDAVRQEATGKLARLIARAAQAVPAQPEASDE